MLTTPLKKRFCHRRQKMKNFGLHEDYLKRIAKSLYYVHLPMTNCTSLPVTELAAEIFTQANKFSLNRLDIEKAARYTRNGCISPYLLVLALLYLERLKTSNPKYLTKVPPTELFLISLLVGSKFVQDDGEEDELNNTDWANLTGLSVQEINKAERDFLNAINWKVYVGEAEFWEKFHLLEANVGMKQGSKRGWFTYTELTVLLQLLDLSNVVQCLWSVTSACMLSYTASVLALVGSALLVGQIPGLKLKPRVPMTTDVNDWLTSSPSPVFRDCPMLHATGNEDCTNSSLLDSEPNITKPELTRLSYGDGSRNGVLKDDRSERKDTELDFFHRFHRHHSPSTSSHSPSSFDLFDIDHLIKDKSNSKMYSSWSYGFDLWSDYIRTFLMRDSIPGGLYLVSSF